MERIKIICLPGLGTDHRIFRNLQPLLPFADFLFWDFKEELLPKGEGMKAYAQRLAQELRAQGLAQEENAPVLLGLSLGGFVAVELAKQIPHRRLILVSTIKSNEEAPFIFPIARRLPLYKIIPAWFSRNIVPLISRLARVTDVEGYYLYKDMLRGWSARKLRWARGAAVNWKNEEPPLEYLHIQGTRDHIFPHPRVKTTHEIKGGTHYMIMDRAEEIAAIIKKDLGYEL